MLGLGNSVSNIPYSAGYVVTKSVSLDGTNDHIVITDSVANDVKNIVIDINKRNKLLIETDWMANSDVTMSDDWKTYRQQLRDLPSGLDTVEKVNAKEFPTKPSGV